MHHKVGLRELLRWKSIEARTNLVVRSMLSLHLTAYAFVRPASLPLPTTAAICWSASASRPAVTVAMYGGGGGSSAFSPDRNDIRHSPFKYDQSHA